MITLVFQCGTLGWFIVVMALVGVASSIQARRDHERAMRRVIFWAAPVVALGIVNFALGLRAVVEAANPIPDPTYRLALVLEGVREATANLILAGVLVLGMVGVSLLLRVAGFDRAGKAANASQAAGDLAEVPVPISSSRVAP
jgi:hypothetical protein